MSEVTSPNKKKGMSVLLKMLIALVLFLLLLLAGGWIWSGSNGSLKQGLGFAQRFLKPGQTLTASDVEGSLRHGGRVGLLTWQQEGLAVELTNVSWELGSLSFSAIGVDVASVDRVQVIPAAPVPIAAAPVAGVIGEKKIPPTQIVLPIHLNVKRLQVHEVIVGKDTNDVMASNIDLSYKFDGKSHDLKLASVHAADGDYQGQVTLQTPSLQVDASLVGKLTAAIPESQQKVSIDANAKVSGVLTAMNVDANAQASTNVKDAAHATKAELKAVVMPWEALMLPQVDLTLQAFNAQAFLAQAPQTLLSGTAVVKTSAQGAGQVSHIDLNMKNAAAGAWDASKLPVTSLSAKMQLQGELLTIDQFNAFMGQGQGQVHVVGNYHLPAKGQSVTTSAWKANVTLKDVDPHLVYSQVASDKVGGTVVASQRAGQPAIDFDVKLNMARGSNVPYFRVKNVTAHGQFVVGSHVQLAALNVQAASERVEGKNIRYALKGQAVSGPLSVTAPGIRAQVTLNGFAAYAGSAQVSLSVDKADQAIQWMEGLPINLGAVLPFLKQASKHVQNITNYTQELPILVQGGWKKPHVTLQGDANALIAKIVQAAAQSKLQEQLGDKLPQGLGSLLGGKKPAPEKGAGNAEEPDQSKDAAEKLLRGLFR